MEHNPLIVVIDDEPDALAALESGLAGAAPGAEIQGFSDCGSFRRAFEPGRLEFLRLLVVDAVLTRGESGWDLLADFKATWPHVRRLLVSNKVTVPDLESAINLSRPDGFLVKQLPFSRKAEEFLRELVYSEREVLPVGFARAEGLVKGLATIPCGNKAAAGPYRDTVLSLLRFVFYPQLQAGGVEIPIGGGAARPDGVFYNAAARGPLFDLKVAGFSPILPVEVKNRAKIGPDSFLQIGAYVELYRASAGFLVFRGSIKRRHLKQVELLRGKEKQVLLLTDEILAELALRKITAARDGRPWEASVDETLRRAILA